jgi:hypothetical protein
MIKKTSLIHLIGRSSPLFAADIARNDALLRASLIDLFNHMIPEFHHKETGKFLDGRM